MTNPNPSPIGIGFGFVLFGAHRKRRLLPQSSFLVGMTGFEPAASASRTQRSTKLSHIPKLYQYIQLQGKSQEEYQKNWIA